MPELSLLEIIKYAYSSIISSKVLVLIVLEAAILLVHFIFKRFIDRKIVDSCSIGASIIVLGLYITNYINTIITFINNVSTKFMEFIYFPTTLEFVIIMLISFMIMAITYIKKKGVILKTCNTIMPLIISFLFLSIIEFINTNKIPFDEFSVFTNPTLMSLYELAMGLFIAWMMGLLIYKVDKFIIDKVSIERNIERMTTELIEIPDFLEENIEDEDFIELPRLKSEM